METNLVTIQDGRAVTSSLQVSQTFEMRHCDVLRAIRNLDCSKDFQERNFASTFYISEIGKGAQKKNPMCLITKDGFTFLVMGFTGAKAAKFKEDYINAFNQLEEYIKQQKAEVKQPKYKYQNQKVDTYLTPDEAVQLQQISKKLGYASVNQLLQVLVHGVIDGSSHIHEVRMLKDEVKWWKDMLKISQSTNDTLHFVIDDKSKMVDNLFILIGEERARRKDAEKKLKLVQTTLA